MYIKLKYISQDILFISPVTLTLLRRESSSWTLSSGNIICITLVKKNLQISFLNYFDTRTVKKQNKKKHFFFVNCSTSDFSPSYWDIRINGLVTEKCSLCCRVKFEVPLRMHHTSMQLYGTYNHIFHYIGTAQSRAVSISFTANAFCLLWVHR